MILVDTSVWIEFFRGNKKIHNELKSLLEFRNVYATEPVFAELIQGARGKKERNILLEYWNNLPKPKTDSSILEAAMFSSENKLLSKGVGVIDAMILLNAYNNDLKLWTLDKKLQKVCKKKHLFLTGT